ncbi:olfactory receptor 6Y1-like [Crotalus tigris]|uniref:olfactory receptor 6Y1-like n=1 Tax=Crotalus tigris TaxID=88082 RepID=UPI00192F95B2|nr:olfactory receptor 6Y1-like [Crotalus tigris]XP_039225341.1 olfactory receptor 6Y1-like [Crotalus tigris]XP_039225342.1 olfactory receptor 6Y1-like [Crotalus tigris]XP_039225343.1 olfactory receptor 6Y1-like [Crotalus tigris]XP_039225344.1 olfactory receptor 6Y1-like [Crotalus tigris]XP_039225345.1 olfactory receptor 6Y1-like [Crotalus tigris]XP_039225347.1 olfactory receptor 6Y1-like [Crotalus tigris]
MEDTNQTNVSFFILLGFPTNAELQILFFVLFLFAYLMIVMENIIILVVIWVNSNLHKPMYLFLCNLSFLEVWYITTIVPKMLGNFLSQEKHISFQGCLTQLYFFVSFMCSEFVLLAVMSYDRYLAICYPLRYPVLMNNNFCAWLSAGCWICGFVTSMIKLSFIGQLKYCNTYKINHYFCDISPLLNVSCTDSSIAELVDFILALMVIMVPLCMVVASYIYIISTILKIPSAQGRKKAFSTCSSHLTVVVLFYSTTLFTYARPKAMYAYNSNKVVSVLYTVIVPLLNPLIYCLRNKEINCALRKTFSRQGNI